jgi:hypothetical protein
VQIYFVCSCFPAQCWIRITLPATAHETGSRLDISVASFSLPGHHPIALINMCGPETTNRPRGGAIAILSPPASSNSQSRQSSSNLFSPDTRIPSAREGGGGVFGADIYFHNPDSPQSSRATYARLALDEQSSWTGDNTSSAWQVVIQ